LRLKRRNKGSEVGGKERAGEKLEKKKKNFDCGKQDRIAGGRRGGGGRGTCSHGTTRSSIRFRSHRLENGNEGRGVAAGSEGSMREKKETTRESRGGLPPEERNGRRREKKTEEY